MKKFYFLLVTFLFLAVANAQIINIPDANFKAKLLAASSSNFIASTATPVYNSVDSSWSISSFNTIDTNNDGEIQVIEAQAIKYLNVSYNNIANLEGIVSFINIIYLNCNDNQIPSLNVQILANLQYLDCSVNQLPSLNVQGLANLNYLNCYNNQIGSLNVQGLANLNYLNCVYNQLTYLNVQESVNLQILDCSYNQLPLLNVQGITNLQYLDCVYNQLTSLNVQESINLQKLICSNNQLPSLNVLGLTNLQNLYCNNNQLASLNVQGLENLQTFNCKNNQLTELFIKNNNISWEELNFINNPNLAYICTDEDYISLVQTKLNQYGYTNCSVDSNCSLSVTTISLQNNYFSIYPNSVKNELNLSTKQATTIYSLSIYNTLGQQVQTTTNPEKTIDVTGLKTGNYIVKVTTDKGVSSSKFVKE